MASASAVAAAVHALYYDPDPAIKKQAEGFLDALRGDPSAWELAWVLIQDDNAIELRYYACKLMQNKILRQWDQLAEENRKALAEELLGILVRAAGGPKIISTRLAVAYAALLMQAVPQTLSDVGAAIRAAYEAQVGVITVENAMAAMIGTFAVILEEYEQLGGAQPGKDALRREMQQLGDIALGFAASALAAGGALAEACLACVKALLTNGLVPIDALEHLSQTMVGLLHNEELAESAADTLVEVVHYPHLARNPNVAWLLVRALTDLHEPLRSAFTAGDTESVRPVARVAMHMGDRFCRSLVECTSQQELELALRFVDFVLEITNAPGQYPTDETLSGMTPHFWYCIIDNVADVDRERYPGVVDAFTPKLMTMMQVLARKLRRPLSGEGFGQDERSTFDTYRFDHGENLQYCTSLLKDKCIEALHGMLIEAMQDGSWQAPEAVLFCLARAAEATEPTMMSPAALLSMIPQMPAHLLLSRTAILCVGEFSDWLQHHHETQSMAIGYLLRHVTEPSLSVAAAGALRNICNDDNGNLCAFTGEVESVCQAVLSGDRFPAKARRSMVEAHCAILRHLSEEPLMAHSALLVQHLSSELSRLCELEMTPANHTRLMAHVMLLQSACTFLDPEQARAGKPEEQLSPTHGRHPIDDLLQRAWPTLATILIQASGQDELADEVTSLILKVQRNLSDRFVKWVPHVLSAFEQALQSRSGPAVLRAAASIVKGVPAVRRSSPTMSEEQTAIAHFAGVATASTFAALAGGAMRECPDLAEGYMHFLAKVTMLHAEVILTDAVLDGSAAGRPGEGLLHFVGQALLSMSEPPLVRQTSEALQALCSVADRLPPLADALAQATPAWIRGTLEAVAGRAASSTVAALGRALASLCQTAPDVSTRVLHELLRDPTFPFPGAPPEAAANLLKALGRARGHPIRFRKAIEDYSSACRRAVLARPLFAE